MRIINDFHKDKQTKNLKGPKNSVYTIKFLITLKQMHCCFTTLFILFFLKSKKKKKIYILKSTKRNLRNCCLFQCCYENTGNKHPEIQNKRQTHSLCSSLTGQWTSTGYYQEHIHEMNVNAA